MPIDPKVSALLARMQQLGMRPLTGLSPEEGRQMILNSMGKGTSPIPVASVLNRVIPGPAGDLPVRIYAPNGTGPFPVLVFFHGGGFVLCDLDTVDQICRSLCAGAGCAVISVGYRLAPENKFPAAVDDTLAATRWAGEYTSLIGGDPKRIAVAGDSAGGTLTTVTALRIRDEGGPAICGQLLLYPCTDYHIPGTPSLREHSGLSISVEDMAWFIGHYLNDESEVNNPYAFPMRAPDLSGLPPALVITAEYDPLRDEGEIYAERLKSAGVEVTLRRYDGMVHAFINFLGVIGQAQEAIDYACSWLSGRFSINVSQNERRVER